MKISSHWRLATTIGLVLMAAIVVALPAISVLRPPLGATFFSVAFLAVALAIAAVIWLYNYQGSHVFTEARDLNGLIKTIPLIFFTLNQKMQVSRFYSARFDEFFYGKNFGTGTDFVNIISFLTDAQLRQQAGDYVKLMLAQASSATIGTNPLECVSARMLNSEGRPELRHFKFAFTDYFENSYFVGVLVAIYDISDVVNTRAQLQALTQKSEQKIQSSVNLMIRLMKLDREMLKDNLICFEDLLDEVNLSLKDSGHSGVRYQTLADQLCKKIKLLKNDATTLDLTELSVSAGEMAIELQTLGQKAELSGNDFFSVALKLDELYDCLHQLSALLEQLPSISLPNTGLAFTHSEKRVTASTTAHLVELPQIAPATQVLLGDTEKPVSFTGDMEKSVSPLGDTEKSVSPTGDTAKPVPTSTDVAPLVDAANTKPAPTSGIAPTRSLRFEFALIQQACIRTAEKLGKKVAISAQNLVAEAIPDRLKQPLTEILVQLIRSSLANGLELPAVRAAAGKNETGTLTLTWTELANGGYELVFRDDGCGLNFDLIRARALALNRLSATQLEALESRQLVGFIFEPGFSASITTGDNAGFGVGLDLVMAAVKRAGGKISVGTQPGLYTQFRVSFPELEELS